MLYVPVAVNCCVYPAAIDAVPGVTAIEVRTAGVTVNAADPWIVPEVAVIVVAPIATAVASPEWAGIVAVAMEDEVHVADRVRFCVVPLL